MKYQLSIHTVDDRIIRILHVNDGTLQQVPVFYMHDGQNLFDNKTAAYGVSWGLIQEWKKHHLPPMVVVGIDCRPGEDRLNDYSPFINTELQEETEWVHGPVGGQGDAYLEWIVNRLKPWVEEHFPVSKDPFHTAIGGSSMGGFISTYALIKYPHVFTRAACLSNAYWFADKELLKAIKKATVNHIQKLVIDIGTAEAGIEKSTQRYIETNRKVVKAFHQKGLTDQQLRYQEIEGAKHHESAWRKRIADIIKFIFDLS